MVQKEREKFGAAAAVQRIVGTARDVFPSVEAPNLWLTSSARTAGMLMLLRPEGTGRCVHIPALTNDVVQVHRRIITASAERG